MIPELVDPEYLFVQISIKLTYDPTVTILGKNEIVTVVKSAVTDYIKNDLEKFDKDLYFSKLSRKIDLASDSIIGNEISSFNMVIMNRWGKELYRTNNIDNLQALCRNCHGKKTFKDIIN